MKLIGTTLLIIIFLFIFAAALCWGFGEESLFWRALTPAAILSSALIALIGAEKAIRVTREQINQAAEQYHHERRQRYKAARAVLPLACHKITDYAKDIIERTKKACGDLDKGRDTNFTAPHFPEEAITALRDMIESADQDQDAELIQSLTRLIRDIQVLRARSSTVPQSPEIRTPGRRDFFDSSNCRPTLEQAAKVYKWMSGMFKFTDEETGQPPMEPSYDEIIETLAEFRILPKA